MIAPRLLAVVLALGWVASVVLPVASAGPKATVYGGGLFMVSGWLAILGGQPAWLANPLLAIVIGLIALGRPVPWAVGGFLAACFVSALFLTTLPSDAGDVLIRSFHAGYYVWLTLVAAAAASPLLTPRPPAAPAA